VCSQKCTKFLYSACYCCQILFRFFLSTNYIEFLNIMCISIRQVACELPVAQRRTNMAKPVVALVDLLLISRRTYLRMYPVMEILLNMILLEGGCVLMVWILQMFSLPSIFIWLVYIKV